MKHWKKTTTLLVSAVLLMTAAVGTTLAFLSTSTDPVTNIFTPSKVTTVVYEEGTETATKNNVKIQNTGDTEAYIRAAVIVTWQDADGNVYGSKKPVEGTDYNIEWTGITNDTWVKGSDGFYYHKTPVKPVTEDAEICYTEVLFTGCSVNDGKAPEGYFLNVEILGSGIQSKPASVVVQEWGVTMNGDTITAKN